MDAKVETPADFATHEVFNQPPPLQDVNLFTGDKALVETVEREGGSQARASLTAFGATSTPCCCSTVYGWLWSLVVGGYSS